MSKSLVDIISTADPHWIDGTSIVLLGDGRWQVNAPSRFAKNAHAVEINADLCVALRDAWSPYGVEEPELTAAELEE